jgi:hypothetical protein
MFMKNKLVYLATIALMAGGMAMAQSTPTPQNATPSRTNMGGNGNAGDNLPGAKEDETRGTTVPADRGDVRPGAGGMGQAADQGRSPKGTNPATGTADGQKGTTDTNNSLPATESIPPQN